MKSIDREGPHGNDSFFTSFAKQAHDGNIAVEVQVVGAERHSLRYASSRRVKKFEQSCVAQANRGIVCMSGVEEAPNLIDRQSLGQVTALTRSMQRRSHIHPNSTLGERVLVQSADRGGRAGNGRGRSGFASDVT